MLSLRCMHTSVLAITRTTPAKHIPMTSRLYAASCSYRFIKANMATRSHRVVASRLVAKVQPVDDVVLTTATSEMLESDRQWLSIQIQTWLDEEWTPLDVHKDLGEAAADAYVTARKHGEHEMTGLLLSVCNQLLSFNYRETFTSAFEVGNKVAELLMLRQGCDVCCTNEEDQQRFKRVDEQIAAGSCAH